jgi:hypothetical protein
MRKSVLLILVVVCCAGVRAAGDEPRRNWTHYVRIGAYGLEPGRARAIVQDATEHHVFGIEVDNDVTGRYESFLDPALKLSAIREVAEAAHRANNKAFVYIAGTECITAHAAEAPHSVAKDHPDWLQRKVTGEPAVFTSGAAFWIRPGDEDVWISPYARDWRTTYMERVRQIAGTGIDGIYVDIPYWMTHFEGWESSWASFDDYTVEAFKQQTGLDARHEVPLGDFSSPNFRKWIDFRIHTLTEFIREIRQNARSVSPSIMVIPEIYPGIEEEATRVGADVYEMYDVADAIAHEYEFGEGDHMASSRSELDWFLYQAGILSFRSFAGGKATWILNYSWDGDQGVDRREAMKTLAASEIVAGANFWDAPGHSMAGSNSPETRALLLEWIEKHQETFYNPRLPMHPVGVYFSPKSRDYDAKNFLPSFRGVLLLLLQQHREFQVVTPRTLGNFRGQVLVLPNVSIWSAPEEHLLGTFAAKGGRVVTTGTEAPDLGAKPSERFPECPGRKYFENLQSDFARTSQQVPRRFLEAVANGSDLTVSAAPDMAVNFALVDGKPHVFLANFKGVIPRKNVKPVPEPNVRLITKAKGCVLKVLPFLGEEQAVPGRTDGNLATFTLPAIERGAAVWLDQCQ